MSPLSSAECSAYKIMRNDGCLMIGNGISLGIIQPFSYATARRMNGKGTYEYLRQEFPQALSHNFINAVEQLIVKKINIRNFFLNGTEYYLFGKILLQNLFLLVTFSGCYYVQISRY